MPGRLYPLFHIVLLLLPPQLLHADSPPSVEPAAADTLQFADRVDDQRSRHRRLDALLQEYLQESGVTRFNGDATVIIQQTVSDSGSAATGTGSFDLFVSNHLGDRTLLFVDLEVIGGNGPNENVLTLSSLNGDAGSTQTLDGLDRLHVLEAWAEFTAFERVATITVGKIDLTNYFDNNALANDETSQFISGAFVNSAALPLVENTPGVHFRADIENPGYFEVGLASRDNSGNRLFDEVFAIAGTAFRTDFGERGVGTYRVFGYIDGALDNTKGFGLSLDQGLGGTARIFARWNVNERRLGEAFGIRWAWSAGTQIDRHLFDTDVRIGAAFGVISPSDDSLNEHVLEVYARVPLNERIHVSPHVQGVWNAGGMKSDLAIFGFRTQFDF